MANHLHLLLETPRANLSRTMHWLLVSYTVWHNRRHHRSGHLFQGRFHAGLLEADDAALDVSKYIHLNTVAVERLKLGKSGRGARAAGLGPVAPARLVSERRRELRKYAWSSYRVYAGLEPGPAWLTTRWLLSHVGSTAKTSSASAYRESVERTLAEDADQNPWDHAAGMVLGSEAFVEDVRKRLSGDLREQPDLNRLAGKVEFDRIIAVVEKAKGESWGRFRDRHDDWGRDAVMHLARTMGGYKLTELAGKVGIAYKSVATALARMPDRIAKDPALARALSKALVQLKNEEM
jgi:hypothetical protein